MVEQLHFQGETAIAILLVAIIPTVRNLMLAKDLMQRHRLSRPAAPIHFTGALNRLPAEATDLLVVGQQEVYRLSQGCLDKGGKRGQHGADEALHVSGAATEQPAVPDLRREWVGVPVLPLDRHAVSVPGQGNSTVRAAVVSRDGDDEVGLGPVPVRKRDWCQAETLELLGDEADELEVRPATGGVDGHQPRDPVHCGGHGRSFQSGQEDDRDGFPRGRSVMKRNVAHANNTCRNLVRSADFRHYGKSYDRFRQAYRE